jgi:hypothetical protein
MKLSLLMVVSAASTVLAADCDGFECVRYGTTTPCASPEAGRFKPHCDSTCLTRDFEWILVSGNSFFGTNCHAYRNPDCTDEIGETGNIVSDKCKAFPRGKSMRCFFKC